MASWSIALISSDEIEPVREILSLVREAQSLASRLISESEQEYQNLRNSERPEDSDSARRFYWLRWQRDALRNFADQQAQVTENLWTETNNVWQEPELVDAENKVGVVVSDTAMAV